MKVQSPLWTAGFGGKMSYPSGETRIICSGTMLTHLH